MMLRKNMSPVPTKKEAPTSFVHSRMSSVEESPQKSKKLAEGIDNAEFKAIEQRHE